MHSQSPPATPSITTLCPPTYFQYDPSVGTTLFLRHIIVRRAPVPPPPLILHPFPAPSSLHCTPHSISLPAYSLIAIPSTRRLSPLPLVGRYPCTPKVPLVLISSPLPLCRHLSCRGTPTKTTRDQTLASDVEHVLGVGPCSLYVGI